MLKSTKSVQMMLNANPIALVFEQRFNTQDKIHHIIINLSLADYQALLASDSQTIQAFNELASYLIGSSITATTIDRYRRQVLAHLRTSSSSLEQVI